MDVWSLIAAITLKQNNTFEGVPDFYLWGMNPGAKTYGMEADPPRYPWSKYECFLMSGWWDIPHYRHFKVKLCGKFHACDRRMTIQTDERNDEN